MPSWGPLVLIAASVSLVVALVRIWRRKLANAPPEPEPAKPTRPGPPFGSQRPAPTRTPPSGFVVPPGVEPAFVVWWQRVEGAAVFWLCREAGEDGAWWVAWYAPWRRGLPDRLWVGDSAAPDAEHRHGEGPVVSWSGTEHRPLLASDQALWRELLQCGLPVELHRGDEGVALRVPGGRVRDAFDLGSLAAMAALLEARVSDDVLPQPSDIPSVSLRVAHGDQRTRVYGDLPPFGGLVRDGDAWRLVCVGARDDEGAVVDLWPHALRLTPAAAEGTSPARDESAPTLAVDVDGHGPGSLRALDGDGRRLQL